MRRLALLVPLLLANACSAPDPCAGKSGTCIAAHVDGNAHDLTSVRVTLPDMRMTVTQSASGGIKLPAQFAILFSSDAPASPFDVRIEGVRGSDVVASDARSVTIANMRARVDFTLNEIGGGGSGGDGGGNGPDMAVMNPPVVSPLTPIAVDELQPISVDFTATDPLGAGDVTLSASQLPGNATFTATATGGTLKWTPGYTDAGSYTVKITATPTDPTRIATYDLPITIKNAADPIIIGGAAALGAVPIGDWDKDGFGDLAVCTGDPAGATGKYHIKILYGAATGLPLDSTTQAARTDTFDIAATNLGGAPYSCKGGDYDGDGHADIIFADPANDYWHAQDAANNSPNQGMFTVMFGGARGVVPPTITILGNTNFGQRLGVNFAVGDFTGDGKADIGTTWNTNAGTYALFPGAARVNVTNSANEIDYTANGFTCHDPIALAFTDFDKDGKADWVLQDPGLNYTGSTSTCDAAHMQAGGIRVIKGRSVAPLLQDNAGDEGTRWEMYYAPTAVPAGSRFAWATLGAGCDVDNDGFGDLGVLWPYGAVNGTARGEVYYGSSTGIVATAKMPMLSDLTMNGFMFASVQPPQIACAAAYKGKPALVVSEGFGTPGALHFFAGKPLAAVGTMTSPDAGDSGFGDAILSGNRTDVDGDGKEDLVVISSQFGWVIYGR
jgi:putative Ig domain-containing protein